MQNVTRNIKLNMQKTMIIICQQCVKTSTFSLPFHKLFSPFLAKTHRNQDLGMGKNEVGPPPPSLLNHESEGIVVHLCLLNHESEGI